MTAKKILLADGSAAILMRIHAALTERNYETLTARNGEDAFITAITERPDLVVIDSAIPGMDALEACRRLRQNELTRTTPVILASAASEPDTSPGHGDLFADTLRKPIDTDDLLSKLEKHLGDR
jgi:two-component system phosphate regulon response regulator PhoB